MSIGTVNICEIENKDGPKARPAGRIHDLAIVERENTVVRLLYGRSFEVGDGVVIFGAGNDHPLVSPEKPVVEVHGQRGSRVRQYRIAAISEEMGHTLASEVALVTDAPDDFSEVNFVRVKPARDMPDAYQYIVYGKDGVEGTLEDFKLVGAFIANPSYGRGRHTVFFDDKSGKSTDDKDIPAYIPASAPNTIGKNLHRSWIKNIDKINNKVQLTLAQAPLETLDKADIFQDNLEAFQAINLWGKPDPAHIFVPHGDYRFFGNLVLTHRAHWEGEDPKSSLLVFAPGFGVVITTTRKHEIHGGVDSAGSSEFERIGFLASGNSPLPAGGQYVSSDSWHGAGLLATVGTIWYKCEFLQFRGSGHVVFGSQDTNSNASHTQIDLCSSYGNFGHGFVSEGGEAQAGSWTRCSASHNHGWGISNIGGLGNQMYACHTDGNRQGPYRVENGFSTIVGCYSEMGQKPSFGGLQTVVLGGDHGAGWDDLPADGAVQNPTLGALRIFNRFHVSPFQIIINQGRKDKPNIRFSLGPWGKGSDLYGFSAQNTPLHNGVSWDLGLKRIIYRFASGLTHTAWEWCTENVRGSGLMALPRGFLLGPRQQERRVSGTFGIPKKDNLIFDKGDLYIDLYGKDLFYRPKAKGGPSTQPWQPQKGYYVGDIVAPGNGFVYVVTKVANGSGGQTGVKEPAWPLDNNEFTDGSLTWQRWGVENPEFETVGRHRIETLLRFKDNSIPAFSTTEPEEALLFKGVAVGDSIVATPHFRPADGLIWQTYVREADHVVVRMANLTSTAVAMPVGKWTLELANLSVH